MPLSPPLFPFPSPPLPSPSSLRTPVHLHTCPLITHLYHHVSRGTNKTIDYCITLLLSLPFSLPLSPFPLFRLCLPFSPLSSYFSSFSFVLSSFPFPFPSIPPSPRYFSPFSPSTYTTHNFPSFSYYYGYYYLFSPLPPLFAFLLCISRRHKFINRHRHRKNVPIEK